MSTASVSGTVYPHVAQRLQKAGGVAGMLVLPLFAATVILVTWAEWSFLHGLGWTVLHPHAVNYPSGLARGRYGAVQSLNFAVLGLLVIVFARGLSTQFTHRAPGILARLGLGAAAAGGLLSAFPTDLPGEPASWHGFLHGLGFVLLMIGNLVAFVAAGLALRGAPGWRGYWLYSVLNTPLAVLVAVVLAPLDQVSFYALIVVLLVWYAVLGWRLYRLAGS